MPRLNKEEPTTTFSKMLLKRYFSILCGLGDKTKSCRLCAVLPCRLQSLLSALGCGSCHWGGEAGKCRLLQQTDFIVLGASISQPLGSNLLVDLLKQKELKELSPYIPSFFFSSFMIFLYRKKVLRKGPEVNLVTHFPFLGLVVKISHKIWLYF